MHSCSSLDVTNRVGQSNVTTAVFKVSSVWHGHGTPVLAPHVKSRGCTSTVVGYRLCHICHVRPPRAPRVCCWRAEKDVDHIILHSSPIDSRAGAAFSQALFFEAAQI